MISGGITLSANANSISFDMDPYLANPQEQVAVTIYFDFTDFGMFGGGFNVIYDANVLEFVGYTQVVFSGPGAPQVGASPLGALASPGNYLGAGVGTFEFLNGISTIDIVGTFLFNVLGGGGDGGCGATLCLTPVGINPMVTLGGSDITNEVFANGLSAANVLTDTDGDGDPDVTDPDDDNDGIGDALDTKPLVASNECTSFDGDNATLGVQVIADLTCAAPAFIDVQGATQVFGPDGDLLLIAPSVGIQSGVNVATKLTVIAADPCPDCPPP